MYSHLDMSFCFFLGWTEQCHVQDFISLIRERGAVKNCAQRKPHLLCINNAKCTHETKGGEHIIPIQTQLYSDKLWRNESTGMKFDSMESMR